MKTLMNVWLEIGRITWKVLALAWLFVDVVIGLIAMVPCFIVCTIKNCIDPCGNPYRLCYQVVYTMVKIAFVPIRICGDSEEEILSDCDELGEQFGLDFKASDDYEEIKRYAEL